MTTPAKVLELAKKEVDAKYKEGNNNDTKFGKWYGNNNQPWCPSLSPGSFISREALPLLVSKLQRDSTTATPDLPGSENTDN